MQVLKKVCFAALCFMAASCSSTGIKNEGGADGFSSDIAEINISDSKSFRVGMLLPLSGADSKYGQGLKNASMLAIQDLNNPDLVIQYYDTQSTPAGARIAIENAINQRSELIVGPLKSGEVQAISDETIYRGVPVIAFSTAQEVLQPTIYTLGLLIDEQIDRIISYAAAQGRKRFALLLPDNATGGSVARAAVKSAQKNNVSITVIGFYPAGTSDFSQIAKDMTNYEQRHARVINIRNKLQPMADNGDIHAQKALKKLETREGLGDIGFDAIIIPESGAKLTSAISMLAYYDAAFPDVQFLGTAIWDTSKLNNEAIVAKSIYPTISKDKTHAFAAQYYTVFNDRPSSLYTLAYDALNIANNLSSSDSSTINDRITSAEGFNGLNGKVRFFKDGSNQHSLDIVEILPSGNIIIDNGGAYFETVNEPLPSAEISVDYKLPKIYGKDSTLAQILIYGQPLPAENQNSDETDKQADWEAASKQLKEMGIYIN